METIGMDKDWYGNGEYSDYGQAKELMEGASDQFTAKEHMKQCRDRAVWEDLPDPEWCRGLAPVDIDTYTDGSVTNPKYRHYAFGGVGVWDVDIMLGVGVCCFGDIVRLGVCHFGIIFRVRVRHHKSARGEGVGHHEAVAHRFGGVVLGRGGGGDRLWFSRGLAYSFGLDRNIAQQFVLLLALKYMYRHGQGM